MLGGRIGRDTLIYAAGTAMVLPFSLVTVAVLTRYLAPAAYGELAVMLVFASLLTTVYNLGSLQGTFMWVWGAGDEGAEVGEEGGGAVSGTKRRALGTGLLLTVLVVTSLTVPIALAAGPIGELLLGRDDAAGTVRLAAASGGLGSIWRLAVNLFRME